MIDQFSNIHNDVSFSKVPVINGSEERWDATFNACDPMLHDVVLAGASALQSGVELWRSDVARELVQEGQLLDEAGLINRDLATELQKYNGHSYRPQAYDLALAGLYVVSAANQMSRMMEMYRDDLVSNDSTAVGIHLIEHDLAISVDDRVSQEINDKVAVSGVSAIKSRVATIDPHHRRLLVSRNTRMSLALAIGPDQSISVTLNTSIYNAAKQTAMVRLTGAARRGDFVNEKPDNPSFTSLYDQYTLAISALLQHAE